jgi:indole-3-glycerol phosphate synthase
LIASILDSNQLLEFESIAQNLGLDVLVEIHDVEELKKIEQMETSLIGINNRNLKTFKTDISNSINLGKLISGDKIVVTESGINTKEDIYLMKQNRIKTFLVGERFMRESDPGSALKLLFE